MHRLLQSTAFRIAVLALTLGLLFLGQRGIWDPDEGRYTNVALHMLDSGNWIEPHRSDEVQHWTKPPLTYWAIATSVAAFGRNAWSARLPAALSYLLCVWLAWRVARRLAPASACQAALLYATMLFPIGASHLITTDYPLAACETLAMWGFVEARFGASAHPRWWLALMWAGFALAFLDKGPPGLLPVLAIAAFDIATPGGVRPRAWQWSGLLLFLAIAAPWYITVTARNPGLLDYFLGNEVVSRVASDEFARHGEWYGWIAIYGPTLIIGTLPWTPALWRWTRALPASVRGWRTADGRRTDGAGLFLALWVLLPLLVFCISRSRLPLYILPLFVPLAVIATRQRLREGLSLPRWRWLGLWSAAVFAVMLATAHWQTHKDASAWATAIHARAPGAVGQIDIVEDMARYGLNLHLGVDVEKLSLRRQPQPRFNPEYDETVADELRDDYRPDSLWMTKQKDWPAARDTIAALGFVAVPQGTPYQDRVLFRVRRAATVHAMVTQTR